MSSRLSSVFAKGVAGYAEGKRRRRCRQTNEGGREAAASTRNVAWAA
ncbi:MAG: hypothetical protein SPI30_00505 [Prevotella sp.]|nr:hypothetical protein [Prevotella sp.]